MRHHSSICIYPTCFNLTRTYETDMTWYNKNTFQSEVLTHTGNHSLYHDGKVATNNTDHPVLDIGTCIDFSKDFTVEFFCYSMGDGRKIVSPVTIRDTSNDCYMVFWPAGNRMYIQWCKSSNTINYKCFTIPETCINRWIHMVVSYVKSTDTIYFGADGKIESYVEGLGSDFSTRTQSKQVSFFIWPAYYASRAFHGYIDNFRISQNALYTTDSVYTVPSTKGWRIGGDTIVYETMSDEEPPRCVTPIVKEEYDIWIDSIIQDFKQHTRIS